MRSSRQLSDSALILCDDVMPIQVTRMYLYWDVTLNHAHSDVMKTETRFLSRRVLIILCVFTLLLVSYFITVEQRYHSGPKLQGTSFKPITCTSGASTNYWLKPLPVDQSYEEAPSDFHLSSDSPTSEQWSHNTSAHRRRYLFFMEIDEQLSANLEKFFQLSYFSALWNFKMVEPWIDKNTEFLSSLPPTGKPQSSLYLDLYNRTALPKILTKCYNSNLPQDRQMDQEFVFHTMCEAMMYSPRQILLIRFMRSSQEWKKGKNGVCENISKGMRQQALRALNAHFQEFKKENTAAYGQSGDFRIWRTICISSIPGTPFSMKNATAFIQKQLEEKQKQGGADVSIVISSWRKVKGVRSGYYYFDPTFSFHTQNCPYYTLPHGPKVFSAVDRMQRAFNLSGYFICIYARTERIAMNTKRYIEDCFKKLPVVLNSTMTSYGIPQSRVVLVHDAGKYGSKSFYRSLRVKASKLLKRIQSLHIKAIHYDPTKNKDLPQHRAFVAIVEMEFLSQSHVLITMGGGGFAAGVQSRFIARQSKERLHNLCS